MSVTEPLHDEHQHLLPRVETLRKAAEAADGGADTVLGAALDDALEFLWNHLVPHARAEDAVLYPAVERVMHAPGATATMTRDHVEVVALTGELQRLRDDDLAGEFTPDRRRDARRLLYGLYAMIRLHFAKEEEIYLPLLDAGLTAAQAEEMFAAMHAEAHGNA
jgi:iron-sulfur cluster repair protein YtfE (RIC family)